MTPEIITLISKLFGDNLFQVLVLILISMSYLKTRRTLKKLRYIELSLIATDYALEKSFKNGYADYRAEKLDELLQRESFITVEKT